MKTAFTPLVDTHCHLEMNDFDVDRDEVMARARAAGITAVITVGSTLEGSIKAVSIAERYPEVYAAVGVHPHDAKDLDEDALRRLADAAAHPKSVAIGETGLDYHYDRSPREVQRDAFVKHLILAGQTGLPVIIHSRNAKEDTMSILRDRRPSAGVLHCFSGDREMAEEALALGLYISIAGPVTFKKAAGLAEVVRIIPDDRILVETDAPYLSPEPLRGRRNEPANLVYTVETIARLREITAEDLRRITTLNANRLFRTGKMADKGEIAYRIRDSLYLNITNRCTNRCSFCIKFSSDFVKGHMLSLKQEPDEQEIINEIGDPTRYSEIVFCGYGEPLTRIETVKNVASWIKSRGGRVRINTNGHADLIHKRDTAPELAGLVDSVSISLDAQDQETYDRICRPAFRDAFQGMIRYIRRIREFVPDVQLTIVEMEGVDTEKCRRIAEELGVGFRTRKLDVVG